MSDRATILASLASWKNHSYRLKQFEVWDNDRKMTKLLPITVHTCSAHSSRGLLSVGNLKLQCALGRSGRRTLKCEGDGATPIGLYKPLFVFYRPDRLIRPRCRLPLKPLNPALGWCDSPTNRNYNRLINHPYPASAERLWREDALYDIIVVLDHNQCPRARNRGSAIFIHVARPGFQPTEGCIALELNALLKLLPHLRADRAIDLIPR